MLSTVEIDKQSMLSTVAIDKQSMPSNYKIDYYSIPINCCNVSLERQHSKPNVEKNTPHLTTV